MGKAEFGELLAFSESFCEKAGECGHRGFTMMAGAMDGKAVMPRRLTYEGPFGVGYGICTFRVTGDDDGRRFLETYESCRKEACKKRRMEEDAYVSLARAVPVSPEELAKKAAELVQIAREYLRYVWTGNC